MFQNGLLIVISGPSGAGKGTVLKVVNEKSINTQFSVSATTRAPRENEIHGVNYFFAKKEEFKQMIAQNQLIEWVTYCENYYGTPRKHVEESLAKGTDIILEIEVEGATHIKEKYPDCVSIFIVPPSFEELKRRIVNRGTENEEYIQKRLAQASKEITLIEHYDYIVVNDTIEKAAEDILSIIHAEKLRIKRNIGRIKEMNYNNNIGGK